MRAMQVLIGEALGPVPEIREMFAEHSRAYREKVQEALEEGIVEGLIRSDVDPAAEAVAFVGTLRGVVGQWMAAPNGFVPSWLGSIPLTGHSTHRHFPFKVSDDAPRSSDGGRVTRPPGDGHSAAAPTRDL